MILTIKTNDSSVIFFEHSFQQITDDNILDAIFDENQQGDIEIIAPKCSIILSRYSVEYIYCGDLLTTIFDSLLLATSEQQYAHVETWIYSNNPIEKFRQYSYNHLLLTYMENKGY